MKMPYAITCRRLCQKEQQMAKPNYSFEKRQRELAKKKKKEEKRQQKLRAKEEGAQGSQPADTDLESDQSE